MSARIIADSPEEAREREFALELLRRVRSTQGVFRKLREEFKKSGDERGAELEEHFGFGGGLVARGVRRHVHYGITWRRNYRRRVTKEVKA